MTVIAEDIAMTQGSHEASGFKAGAIKRAGFSLGGAIIGFIVAWLFFDSLALSLVAAFFGGILGASGAGSGRTGGELSAGGEGGGDCGGD